MVDSLNSLYLFPRSLLGSSKVDLYDAINLVNYAKFPLISARRGKELVAGFIRRDGVMVVPALLSEREKEELLDRYGSEIASFRYPIAPHQYEPLLEKMVGAGEYALPYFFHEYHQLKERRRRAAMFVDLHGELAGLVSKKEIALQITESERTYVMEGSAWMTAETLNAYLERHGVTPWWRNQSNLESHARLERLLLSDGLAVSRPELSNDDDQQQLPSYLFGRMLLSRTGAMRRLSPATEAPRFDATNKAPATDSEFSDSYYKPGKSNRKTKPFQDSDAPCKGESSEDSELDRSCKTQSFVEADNLDSSMGKSEASTETLSYVRDQDRPEGSSIGADDPDDAMLTKREVAALLGVSMNTVDNYRKDFADFPEAVMYGPNTLRWRKSQIERWKRARPAR